MFSEGKGEAQSKSLILSHYCMLLFYPIFALRGQRQLIFGARNATWVWKLSGQCRVHSKLVILLYKNPAPSSPHLHSPSVNMHLTTFSKWKKKVQEIWQKLFMCTYDLYQSRYFLKKKLSSFLWLPAQNYNSPCNFSTIHMTRY